MSHNLISDSIFPLNDIITFQAHLADTFAALWTAAETLSYCICKGEMHLNFDFSRLIYVSRECSG